MRNVTEEIKEKAQKELLSYAIFRPESAIVISLSLILATLTGLGIIPPEGLSNFWWAWLLFGLAGEGALVWSTLNDREALQKIIDDMFREELDLSKIRHPDLKKKLEKALEYRQLIVQEIERKENFVLDDHLMNTVRELDDWLEQIYSLAQNLDVYWRDSVIGRDMKQVPHELDVLRNKLVRQKPGKVRQELERSLETKERQWRSLQSLQETMHRAQLQLDSTLSAMGTIYMQTLNLGAKEIDNTRAQRLQADMHEQILSLEDVTAAMDEVYAQSTF